MENTLKGLEENDLGLAIWSILILTLFKTLSFNIIKKD